MFFRDKITFPPGRSGSPVCPAVQIRQIPGPCSDPPEFCRVQHSHFSSAQTHQTVRLELLQDPRHDLPRRSRVPGDFLMCDLQMDALWDGVAMELLIGFLLWDG